MLNTLIFNVRLSIEVWIEGAKGFGSGAHFPQS